MNHNVTKDLLFDHFAGRATLLQKKMIEEWLFDESAQETFYKWLIEWEHRNPSYAPEIDEPLRRYLGHMEQTDVVSDTTLVESYSLPRSQAQPRRKLWMLAASVMLILSLSVWFNREQILYESFETDFGETRSFLLSDGSRVTLNSNSVLRVPRFGFGKEGRDVVLQGEAYFSVQHKKNNQRFVVKTFKGFDVVVLGTEFSVYARPRGSKVLLSKGKVQVRFEERENAAPIFLKPGELMTLDTLGRTDILPVAAEKITAWKDHRFVFENTEVRELIGMFADIYGLKVEIQGDRLPSRTLEGTFQAANAEELLEAVSELLQISVVRKGNVVTLHE